MNIALVLQHKLLLGIQRFLASTPTPATPAHQHLRSHDHPSVTRTPRLVSTPGSGGAAATRHFAQKAMPLRVLRVVETGMPRSSTGRLVISGRMADVCAELDRLVEREAALH